MDPLASRFWEKVESTITFETSSKSERAVS
jgi:hypothetical protein